MRLTGVLSDTPRVLDRRPLFSNANGAFRRSLWLEHPFDENVGGAEDIAWVRTMQERGYVIAYEPTAMVYHSHGEPLIRHLRRASQDVPTVVGNFLHLGSGGRVTPKPPRTQPAPRGAWSSISSVSWRWSSRTFATRSSHFWRVARRRPRAPTATRSSWATATRNSRRRTRSYGRCARSASTVCCLRRAAAVRARVSSCWRGSTSRSS